MSDEKQKIMVPKLEFVGNNGSYKLTWKESKEELPKEKQKAKVYTLKIGPVLLAFKRKMKKGETVVAHTRAQLLAADIYQANFFGYKPLRFRAWFMSRASIRDYLERKYSEQDDIPKTRFTRLMQRQGDHRARILKTRNAK